VIKLFVGKNSDVPIINWKRIIRDILSGKKAANERAPTIEELQQPVEYPDMYIKFIVYTMVSGGFRLNACVIFTWKHVSIISDLSRCNLYTSFL
jgi:hypothetical protein